jgi:CRISPR type III-A-associated RAMP protein Csm4
MNPGLVVKLRPTGPWRIGPDSGARSRVELLYHSDSLYGALAWSMARLGWLEEWLNDTARAARPAVCCSSCFPFSDDIGFVVPPRTIWPPTSPALLSARVRWKSARFVPLGIVEALLAGQTLDENHWVVDGPSACLMPAGRHGPFRTVARWSAAVDRLSGASERHSTTCLEFRPGAGLWTILSFADAAAQSRWQDRVKTAFRLLADSGFGGERSRGWGRAESPEFIEGTLPDMILAAAPARAPVAEPEPAVVPEPEPQLPPEPQSEVQPEQPQADAHEPEQIEPEPAVAPEPEPERPPGLQAEAQPEQPQADAHEPEQAGPEPAVASEPEPEQQAEAQPQGEQQPEPEPPPPDDIVALSENAVEITPHDPPRAKPYWLLSLFTPNPADAVEWARGDYTILDRGGRVDGSGELKKQLPMVSEGSVVYAAELRGAAPDVAPDGHPHPVFRAGFALSIPLPEAS